MSFYECPAGWGGEPTDPCPQADGMISQDTELVIHVSPHDCIRYENHDLPHVCSCGSTHE